MKDVILSVIIVLVVIIFTVCSSYYFVTKYNIDKENNLIINETSEIKK